MRKLALAPDVVASICWLVLPSVLPVSSLGEEAARVHRDPAETEAAPPAPEFLPRALLAHATFLSAEELAGRAAGTVFEGIAAA